MPSIKASSIRDLKDRISILDVVSREVSMKRAGSNFKGLSPFTQEKTPSFFVSPDKGLYKCFSTGRAGDSISFVMETERLSFIEAVESLAQRFSVQLEFEEGGRPIEDRSLRQELFDLHEFVADFYRDRFLADDKEGDWIRNYWTNERGFDEETAVSFKIGYAPANSKELGERVLKKGFSRDSVEKSGLFYVRHGFDVNSMGYRFRGRLMIPIRDHQGRVTAFTARQLELTPQDDNSREAKYVNSPETPIFTKGNLLFNLDRARMEVNEETPFIMVEGQLDAIRCASVGLKGVIAPQGTGITDQQMRLIKRYEPRLRCFLDGDSAGQKAALRMLPLALAQGIEPSFIPLEQGQDPDDLFKEHGAEALDRLLEKEVSALDFACHSVLPDIEAATPQGKASAARELFQIVAKADSQAAQTEYAKAIAANLGIEQRAILGDFNRFLKGQPATRAKTPVTEPKDEPNARKSAHSVERDLCFICLHDEALGTEIAVAISEEWINTESLEGELLNILLNDFQHEMWSGPDNLIENLEKSDLKTLAADILFEEQTHENPKRLANEAIKRLVSNFADRKIKNIKLEIARKEVHLNDDVLSLLEESTKLQKIKGCPPRI